MSRAFRDMGTTTAGTHEFAQPHSVFPVNSRVFPRALRSLRHASRSPRSRGNSAPELIVIWFDITVANPVGI